MRSLFLAGVFFSVIAIGLRNPFVFVLGYIWLDIVTPQRIAYTILPSIPVSLIMGVLAFGALVWDWIKIGKVKVPYPTYLLILVAAWMTLSMAWAVAPEAAWRKWDVVVKTLLFCAVFPLFLRDNKRIEATLWVIVVSGMAHCIPYATKTLIAGGGYGYAYGLTPNDYGFGEGSTLSMYSVMLFPICRYLRNFQTLVPSKRFSERTLDILSLLCIVTAIGTFARTGLICLGVLAIFYLFVGKNKLLTGVFIALMGVLIISFAPDSWMQRMQSTTDSGETSAMGRVAVWLWVLDYIKSNPLGGGFEMYRINSYTLILENGGLLEIQGKAFHSIYFEILGEGGVVALLIFIVLWILTFNSIRQLMKNAKLKNDSRALALGKTMLLALFVYFAGGAFVGVAFQSFVLFLIAIVSVSQVVFLKSKGLNSATV